MRAAHKKSSFIFIWGLAEAYWCEMEQEYAFCAWHLKLENVTFVPTEICDKEGSPASRVRFRLFLYIFFFFHPTYLVPRTSGGVNNRFQFVTTDVVERAVKRPQKRNRMAQRLGCTMHRVFDLSSDRPLFIFCRSAHHIRITPCLQLLF
jgi:hypothetical protein